MIAVIARGFPLDGGRRVLYWRDDDASLVSLLVRFGILTGSEEEN